MKNSGTTLIMMLSGSMILAVSMIFLSCVSDPCYHHSHNNNYSAQEDFYYQVNIAGQTQLRLYGVNGSIEVTGVADQNVLEIEGTRRVESDSPSDAQRHLKKLSMVIDKFTEEVMVRTVQPSRSDGRNYQVYYRIRVPKNWRIYTHQSNGNVTVKFVQNDVTSEISNGNIHIESCRNNIYAGTTNGNLTFRDLFGSVEGRIINGNIFCGIVMSSGAICDLQTVNGQIDLQIPETTSADFTAQVTNGTIKLNNIVLNNMHSTPNSLSGQFGDGNGTILLITTNGNIEINGFQEQ